MIVNYIEEGWEVITQRAHGILAAQVAMQWKKKERPARWLETLIAIAGHDDAEVELESDDLLTPMGGPVNYAMKKFDLERCQRSIHLSITRSRFIALLTSLHLQFLHKSEAETNRPAREFLKQQEELQQQWQKELGLKKEDVIKIYSLLEWCDAFSLLLCQRRVQPEHRQIEISIGPEGQKYQLFNVKEGEISVTPWPFEISSFMINIETRILKKLRFANVKEFKDAFIEAEVVEKQWKLCEKEVHYKVNKVEK